MEEYSIKSIGGLKWPNDIDRVREERKEKFILNRSSINFGDLLCQVKKIAKKYVRKTPWFRSCGTKYCGCALCHFLSNLALCVKESKSQTQPVPGDKRPKWRMHGIHLKCLLCNQVLKINTLDLYALFSHDTDKQFLRNVLPVAIINEFLSHNFFNSNLDIARNSKNEPHILHEIFFQVCDATDNNNCIQAYTQDCSTYDKFLHTNRYIQTEASMNSTTFEHWN